jgi:uncharacterized membrane protein YfcA
MPVTILAIAVAVVTVASAVQGAVGFGMNLLAVPVLVMLDPTFVPGPSVAAGLVLSALVLVREGGGVDRQLGWALLGLAPGTALALLFLALVTPESLTVIIGSLVLVTVGISALRVTLSPTRFALALAGLASGFLSTAGSIGGPPIALVYAESRGARLRSNLSAFFVVTAAVSLAALAVAGRLHAREGWLTLVLLPGVLIGLVLSNYLRPAVDNGHVRSAVLWLSASAGVGAVIEGFVR